MGEWILIIMFLAAGPSPISLARVPGFYSQKDCTVAGQLAVDRLKDHTDKASFVCVNR
jgi:hypothetical protein